MNYGVTGLVPVSHSKFGAIHEARDEAVEAFCEEQNSPILIYIRDARLTLWAARRIVQHDSVVPSGRGVENHNT